MIMYRIADNILSPLGGTTEENYAAVREGRTKLSLHSGLWNIRESFMASLFEGAETVDGEQKFTAFESLALTSIKKALVATDLDISGKNVVFILSTTKGNIDMLQDGEPVSENISPASSAQRIADELGVKTCPIVVCNACISGLAAIILAQRLLSQGAYDYAVVCGCDIVSRFVVSGFQSFKILSTDFCRPFDSERTGMNLGEAAATIVLSRTSDGSGQWAIEDGAVRNDAGHINAPSSKGEGLFRALTAVMDGKNVNDIATINAHGTGTLFNDQMEAVAFDRAGLSNVPVSALKGFFGHTMGAAGVLETVLTMKALDEGLLLPTKGFENLGVSRDINVLTWEQKTDRKSFIKTVSGFGGCNAAIIASKCPTAPETLATRCLKRVHKVKISPETVEADGKLVEAEGKGAELLVSLYKNHVSDYARFYKMDGLSRLGFIATELLLKAEGCENMEDEDRAIVFFNRSSSISADRHYLHSLEIGDNNPSPAAFTYTLPNIVAGEIAIRNHYHGETAFYILPQKDENCMMSVMETLSQDKAVKSIIGGWLNYEDGGNFEADISLYEL